MLWIWWYMPINAISKFQRSSRCSLSHALNVHSFLNFIFGRCAVDAIDIDHIHYTLLSIYLTHVKNNTHIKSTANWYRYVRFCRSHAFEMIKTDMLMAVRTGSMIVSVYFSLWFYWFECDLHSLIPGSGVSHDWVRKFKYKHILSVYIIDLDFYFNEIYIGLSNAFPFMKLIFLSSILRTQHILANTRWENGHLWIWIYI